MALTAASAGDGDDDSDELSEDYLAVIEALPGLYQCFLHQTRYTAGISLQLHVFTRCPFNLCNFRLEGTVSKAVEFKFLQKLIVLLDIEGRQLQSSSKDTGAAGESHSVGAMETDEGLDLEQVLKHLLAIEEDSAKSSIKLRSMIRVLTKCLELVWQYDIYQVALYTCMYVCLTGGCVDYKYLFRSQRTGILVVSSLESFNIFP
jgi:hypothetical protein